jgi:hypothetical protein
MLIAILFLASLAMGCVAAATLIFSTESVASPIDAGPGPDQPTV